MKSNFDATNAWNKLNLVFNGKIHDSFTGSQFMDILRKHDHSIPEYEEYVRQNGQPGKKAFFPKLVKAMTEEQQQLFYRYMIENYEKYTTGKASEWADLKNHLGIENNPLSIAPKIVVQNQDYDTPYQAALNAIDELYKNSEKLSTTYKDKGEEALRDTILPHLQAQYKNAVATGETINKNGKTDIILKTFDNVNILIAECKIWHGEAELNKALDQLFGYLTHADTRCALIFYVQEKGFNGILTKIESAVGKYPNCMGITKHPTHKNRFICKFKKDEGEVQIEIMAYHFPKN